MKNKRISALIDAISEVLRYTGYSLVDNSKQIKELQETLKKQLPFIQRNFGLLPLRQILNLLIGSPYILRSEVENPMLMRDCKGEESGAH